MPSKQAPKTTRKAKAPPPEPISESASRTPSDPGSNSSGEDYLTTVVQKLTNNSNRRREAKRRTEEDDFLQSAAQLQRETATAYEQEQKQNEEKLKKQLEKLGSLLARRMEYEKTILTHIGALDKASAVIMAEIKAAVKGRIEELSRILEKE